VKSLQPWNGEWKLVGTYGANTTNRLCTRLEFGESYHYQVRAVNASGVSEWVSIKFVAGDALPAPTDLKISNYDRVSGTATLSWTDNATTETQYEVKSLQPWNGEWKLVGTYGANTTNRLCTRLEFGESYHYQVRAVNATGVSEWVGIEFVANEDLNSNDKSDDVISNVFANFFAEETENDFWFELEETLIKRVKW
ncbi:MAG: fibronectin type III domain-containing protein, partial [Thermoguttaceae bacterium]|nr:fibronectin type III domain-containing protein [Thermoguttaceae bacterium]